MFKNLIIGSPTVAAAAVFILMISVTTFGQTLYDSFTDGEFITNPTWMGDTSDWGIVANSDVAAGATGSNTLRLNTAFTGTEYLSSQIANWGTSQEWGVFWGRRFQAHTGSNQQYFWLYANEANLNSATVDGYRLAIGDDSGADEIRLEHIVNGAVNATVISSTGTIPNALTDIGFLIRVRRSSIGNWQLLSSTLPTVSGTGAIATDIPNAANASVSQGTGTDNSLIPAANGYIGVAALHTNGALAVSTAEFDQIYFTPSVLTAANVSLSGQVRKGKMPLSRVTVMLSGGSFLEPRITTTNSFGYYAFENIPVANTYIIQVSSRRYSFTQSSIFISPGDDLTDLDFLAEEL